MQRPVRAPAPAGRGRSPGPAPAADPERARDLLITALLDDPRCIDAHVHLGSLLIEDHPAQARVLYELAAAIGDASLDAGFDDLLPWACLYTRPFLRALQGLALCLWRLGEPDRALELFERLLRLNPNDNQGARFCWHDVRQGRAWRKRSWA